MLPQSSDMETDLTYFDQRLKRLELILTGLDNAVKYLQEEELAIDWYNTMNPKKEFESIYRLAFLAMEDLIKSSITDRVKNVDDYNQYYKLEPQVELIVSLANLCYKESNDKSYTDILKTYSLDPNDYPLYNGLKILNKDRSLMATMTIILSWRRKLDDLVYSVITASKD